AHWRRIPRGQERLRGWVRLSEGLDWCRRRDPRLAAGNRQEELLKLLGVLSRKPLYEWVTRSVSLPSGRRNLMARPRGAARGSAFGKQTTQRAAHAKGVVLRGKFVPSAEAASVSKALHFKHEVPVTVRFSANSGIPKIAEHHGGEFAR